MRVIAGIAKGRRLIPVPGENTRPIMDRVKTALFNIIQPSLEGALFLDLFAGTGGVGIEALSRGATKAIFIELNRKAFQTIQANLEHTQMAESGEARNTDVFSYIKNTAKTFDFIYCDPPQFKGLWTETLQTIAERPEILKPGGLLIVKIHPKEFEEITINTLTLTDNRKYGNSQLLFYSRPL